VSSESVEWLSHVRERRVSERRACVYVRVCGKRVASAQQAEATVLMITGSQIIRGGGGACST
jgi:hypothetical protein